MRLEVRWLNFSLVYPRLRLLLFRNPTVDQVSHPDGLVPCFCAR